MQAKPKRVKNKKKPFWYCDLSKDHPLHGPYHDKEYGIPTTVERVLFERLAMEIMQAGLSWEIVLRKRKALNRAFDRFMPAKIAAYKARDVERLLADPEIIRNRLKILAIIENAKRVLALRKSHGSFSKWLMVHHPQKKQAWVKLFRAQFTFMGEEIVNEFLMGTGYLPGAHRKNCPFYRPLIGEKS